VAQLDRQWAEAVKANLAKKAKKRVQRMADQPPTFVWDEDQEPVSPEAPLEGLETKVLQVWTEASPSLRKALQQTATRNQVENAARLAVHAALLEELTLKSQGMRPEDARELTRPAMWAPPTWSTTTSTTPAPRAAVAQADREWDQAIKANLAKRKRWMQPPLSPSAIKTTWMAQNPALVEALESDGTLDGRLTEAHEQAGLVMADAIARGLSPDQAKELAQDAIGLTVTP